MGRGREFEDLCYLEVHSIGFYVFNTSLFCAYCIVTIVLFVRAQCIEAMMGFTLYSFLLDHVYLVGTYYTSFP